ncbi:MAG: methylenetetrahydrofolate reductase C-terminal domain-containing protein [Desulfomonilaceae bacterium]
MIGTVYKPMDEILSALDDCEKVIVTGCNGCAKVCKTGGEPEIKSMSEKLEAAGKTVVTQLLPERTCYIQHTTGAFQGHEDEIRSTDAFLVLGCGGAAQITRQALEEMGFLKPVKIGLDSVGHMDTVVANKLALEQCQECGECVLNETGGICPVTKCAKSLLNGPCGGAQNGKCEVDHERDCAWIMIYERMKALGEVNKLKEYNAPKDYSKMNKPRRVVLG